MDVIVGRVLHHHPTRTSRDARLRANLTQETAALRVGIDRPSIVEIEAGRRNMTIDTLIGIADAIGVPLADLVR
ncbi:helix-turn-helix transcriptional regulator [Streptomyces sp. NPDC054940]